MKTNTDTKDPDRFNPQQNTDDNRNIQYEKDFTHSYRMNLPTIAEFISTTNWPNGYPEGSNDHDEKSLEYCLEE